MTSEQLGKSQTFDVVSRRTQPLSGEIRTEETGGLTFRGSTRDDGQGQLQTPARSKGSVQSKGSMLFSILIPMSLLNGFD